MAVSIRAFFSLSAALLLLGFAAPAGASDDPWGPGFRTCGSFKSGEYTIKVHAKGMTCKRAKAIQREFWNGPKRRKVEHNGADNASSYVTLKRYPGYRCATGAGAGTCSNSKHTKVAAYDNKVSGR
jgi:hypothetical protein